jgi:hypothetical protein
MYSIRFTMLRLSAFARAFRGGIRLESIRIRNREEEVSEDGIAEHACVHILPYGNPPDNIGDIGSYPYRDRCMRPHRRVCMICPR